MAGKRIDSILVKEAIDKELQYLAANLDELASKIKTFPAIRVKQEGAANVKELSKAQIQYAESLKAVEQLIKQRFATEAKLKTLQTDYAVAIAKNRVEIQKQNKELKTNAELALAQDGSIDRAKAKVKQLTEERNKLNLTTEEGRKRQQELNVQIDKYNEFLRKNVSALEKQKINVGNYEGSAKIIVDSFERVSRKLQQVEKDFGKASPEARAARNEYEALRKITEDPRFLNISAKVGDSNKELRFFTKQLNELETAGLKNSDTYRDVQARLAKLTDQISDTRQEIKALSSDSRSFDLFAGSINFAADAFQTFTGAAILAGASEEEVTEQIRTLVAVQSVANGVKSIANELTTKGTAANKVFAFVQGLVSTSLDKSAASATRLKAALGLIGIAITIVGAVVIALSQLQSKLSTTERAQRNLNKAMEEANDEAGKQVAELKSLYTISQDLNQNLKTRQQATQRILEINKENNERTGEQTKLLVDQNGVLRQQPELIDKISESLIRQAKTKAVLRLIEEAYTDLIKKQTASLTSQTSKLEDVVVKSNNILNKFLKPIAGKFAPPKIDLTELQQNAKNQGVNDANAYLETLQKVLSEGLNSGTLSFEGLFSTKKPGNDKEKEDERRRKAIFEQAKLQLEADASIQRQIVETESFTNSERLQALREYVRIKSQIINEEAAFEKGTKGKIAEEINLIEKQRLQNLSNLNDEARLLFKTSATASVEEVKQEIGEIPPEVQAAMDKMDKAIMDALAKKYPPLSVQIDNVDVKLKLKEVEDLYINTFQSIAVTTNDILGGIFDAQKNRIQEQIDDIDRLKAAEIDRINASGDSEEKKAARVKLIEAKAQADKEALQRRQRELDRQRAVAAKFFNVFQLTVDGIQAVGQAKLLATRARLEFLARGGPANPAAIPYGIAAALAQGQVLQTIITSAAAVAAAAAAPVPKFAKGTDSAPGGPSIVAEQGREIGVDPKGRITMYEKPSLVNLMKGTRIIPNKVTEDIIKAGEMDRLNMYHVFNNNTIKDNGKMEEKTDAVIKQLKELNKKPPVVILTNPAVETTPWFWQHLKY